MRFLLCCLPIWEAMWAFEVRVIVPGGWEHVFQVPFLLFYHCYWSLNVSVYYSYLHMLRLSTHSLILSVFYDIMFIPTTSFCSSQSFIIILLFYCCSFLHISSFFYLYWKALHYVQTVMRKHQVFGFCLETSCLWTLSTLVYLDADVCLISEATSRVRYLVFFVCWVEGNM